jgi:filamentous hemagglutinin family protein
MKNISQRLRHPPVALAALTFALLGAFAGPVAAAPVGGVVVGGSAGIASSGTHTTITQGSANAAINWQGFGIAAGESVRFVQPGSGSVALNRVIGSDPSAIFGSLAANGKVFLVNPNGVLFGPGASVNVGGLVASTLDIGDADFMAGRYTFSGNSRAGVVNRGHIAADGGYVVLLGAAVANQGDISARLGNVTLAAGQAITLDVLGDNLLNVTVDRGVLDALVENGGAIRADGGQVLLTAQAASGMLAGAVNNTGVIQAQTLSSHNGTIKLLGDMGNGVVTVAGTLDASAPHGGNGGFIETSAARVRVNDSARVTTAAALGRTGEWLIDPEDFTIGTGPTDNMSGATLSALLVTNSVVITTSTGPTVTTPGAPPVTDLHTAVAGNGDININDAVSWTAAPNTTTLSLNAARDVNVNQAVTAVNGNFVVCCGRDINVNAAITTTNGSVLLSAGRNILLGAAGAMSTTDGNITMCAADDIRIGSALTLTRGSSIPAQSLGLATGLVLIAGNGGDGPGVAAGTVVFAPLAPPATVTGPNAPVLIAYNPVAYTTPTNYSGNFTLTGGSTLTQRMMVYPDGASKTFDGTTTTSLAGLKGAPAGVVLVAGPASAADFDTAAVGFGKTVTFSGFTLGGPAAADFALPVACCGPVVGRTQGNIIAALPPVLVPPPVAPVPVPVVIAPPPVIVVGPEAGTPPESAMPQFAPFTVAPMLLGPSAPLLFAVPPERPPMMLVTVQAPPAAVPVPAAAAPAEEVVAPAVAPPAPLPIPPRRPAKPFRN